jgi:hypothetical protein
MCGRALPIDWALLDLAARVGYERLGNLKA